MRVSMVDKETRCGFFKNEYVRAETPEEAVQLAKERVVRQMTEDPAINREDAARAVLEVDEVEPNIGFWNSIRREGFIFYPEEQGTETSEGGG